MADTWGFYGRAAETAEIQRILNSGRWFFCAISGRRRIGKTTLIRQAMESRPGPRPFYFQVPDSDERGVVQWFREMLEDEGAPQDYWQRVNSFRDMASVIGTMSRAGNIVIIDEFQYFHRKSLLPFTSFLQAEVDLLRDTREGGLFVLGSIHTEMTAILEDRSSPLFNRVTHRIEVGHWDFATLFEMFSRHGIADAHHALFLWTLFEGIPKFYRDCHEFELLKEIEGYREQTLRRLFFEGSSPLRDEAGNWFLRELRGRYDTILKLLAACGPSSHSQLMTEYRKTGPGADKQVSAYLQILIDRYRMIEKRLPVFSADRTRNARYAITDNFLSAWLSAIARYVERARVQPLEQTVARSNDALQRHEGFAFEKMIAQLHEECSRKAVGDFPLTERVKGYWNKPDGSDIEIDLVAYNDVDKAVRFGSCKRASVRHDAQALRAFDGHIARFLSTGEGRRFAGWRTERALFSPTFSDEERARFGSSGYLCRDLRDYWRWLSLGDLPLLAAASETAE